MKFGADVTRYILCDSAPNSISDANFIETLYKPVTKKLYCEYEWITQLISKMNNIDDNINIFNIWDEIFYNQIIKYFNKCYDCYKQMNFHGVIVCFNNILKIKDSYRLKYENNYWIN